MGFKQDGVFVSTFGESFTWGRNDQTTADITCGLTTKLKVVYEDGWSDEIGFKVFHPDGSLIYEKFKNTFVNTGDRLTTFTVACP